MEQSELVCTSKQRRLDSRKAPLFGLDFIEVELSANHATLQVFFLGKAPPKIANANVRISGGRRIRDVQVTSIHVHRNEDPTLDDYLEVNVDKIGDASLYALSMVNLDAKGHPTEAPMDGFDPRYNAVEFSFRAGCPTDLDCKLPSDCPPPKREQPEINYLAKDYDSFRQLMLDRMALTMPDWQEQHAPDMGIALVEVLAYAGDYLSYYQDAVATEAYLETARQRISVRRHARLVDYSMHEGCNARAWITLNTDTQVALAAKSFFFIAGLDNDDTRVLQPEAYAQLSPGQYTLFEPLVDNTEKPIALYPAHNTIRFYTWGDCACCLPTGATSATLIDEWVTANGETAAAAQVSNTPTPKNEAAPQMQRALKLQVGDVLVFEEVIGPGTGNPDDADPSHRQAVRLTKVTPVVDPLYHPKNSDYGQPIVEIEWCSEDALTFPLCISAKMPPPDCDCRADISVARGNVVLVDNGLTTTESLGTVPTASRTDTCASLCEPPDARVVPTKFHPILSQHPLTFGQALPVCGCSKRYVEQDPRQALPQIQLSGTQTSAHGSVVTTWLAKHDLLNSGADDTHFVVEMDDDGYAHLRFGDNNLGREPEAETVFEATYRIGNGPSGNVGAEKIRCIVFRETTNGIGALAPRNPLSASGGTLPESVEDVKMFAPSAFRSVLERAVTASDYATLAADNMRRLVRRPELLVEASTVIASKMPPHNQPTDPRAAIEEEPAEAKTLGDDICLVPFHPLQGAKGSLRWNGSWYEALVALDQMGGDEPNAELLQEVTVYLEPYRRLGHDLDVRAADYVPLDLTLSVCVKPDYLRAHVEAVLLQVFSNRVLADGRLGFFHPDNLTFGDDIYISRIVALAQTVAGVLDVRVTRLERFNPSEPQTEPDARDLPPDGVLALGPFEIARLDNDPSFPENGRLTLALRGGR